ncbi:MAG: hypothetical protein K9K37_05760 [Desulfocapsa sp.]|nr:hypothetical protein [Desulfocapsa sp.]
MKTSFFSVVLLFLFCLPAGTTSAMSMMETEIVTGTVRKIDSIAITLDNKIRYLFRKESTGKLPFQLNDIVTLRYVVRSDGTFVCVESAKGRDSLVPSKAGAPRRENRFL